MSFASQVKYSPLTDLEEDDGKNVLEISAMDKKSAFEFDSMFTYDNDPKSKKYGAKKNQFSSAFNYNVMTAGR